MVLAFRDSLWLNPFGLEGMPFSHYQHSWENFKLGYFIFEASMLHTSWKVKKRKDEKDITISLPLSTSSWGTLWFPKRGNTTLDRIHCKVSQTLQISSGLSQKLITPVVGFGSSVGHILNYHSINSFCQVSCTLYDIYKENIKIYTILNLNFSLLQKYQ